jgi:hypothetical protein
VHEPLLLTLDYEWDNSSHESSTVGTSTPLLSLVALTRILVRCTKHHNTLRMACEKMAESIQVLLSTSSLMSQRTLDTWGPPELNFLCQQGCHWPGNLGETFDETSIVAGHSNETFDSSDIFRCFPIQNSCCLLRIHS